MWEGETTFPIITCGNGKLDWYVHVYELSVSGMILKPWYSIGGFEWIFISLLKSAAFLLQTLEKDRKPPQNHFKRQIEG